MASRAGRLKERGGGERHAPAKPRLVAVLRSKLRFTCFLQVPTGSHCLSRSPYSSGCWLSRILTVLLPLSVPLLKYRRAHLVSSPYPSGCWYALMSLHFLSIVKFALNSF